MCWAIGSGKVHDVFHGLDDSARTALTVQVRAATGGYQVRASEEARLGPQVIATGVVGTEYFDAFAATLGSFIGI